MSALARHLSTLCVIGLAACGPPDPPNIRQTFGRGIAPLGVVPFYPLNEGARLGQLYLADASTVGSGGDQVSFVPTNVLVTNSAVPYLERYRAEQMAARNRFPCSSERLADQISLTSGARSFYRQQNDCAIPSSGGGATSGSTSPTATATVTVNVNSPPPRESRQAASPRVSKPPESLTPLELAGIPSYSLASIDDVSLAGAVPSAFANFLAAIGLRRSTSLTVEAEGVEVASLPADLFAAGISDACRSSETTFGSLARARSALSYANHELISNAVTRRDYSPDRVFRYDPRLLMLRKIFYLRGIRYVFNDTRAYNAQLAAAANSRLAAGRTPPAVPNITMNVVSAPSAGTGSNSAAVASELAALQSQIDQMRSALGNSTNIEIAGSFARATARGIEFVDLFQRPLAFGYVPISEKFDMAKGLRDFCDAANGNPPLVEGAN